MSTRGVVTIATFNPVFVLMADNLVSSLRAAGKYDGDMVIFTDFPESDFPEATRKSCRIEQVHHGMTVKYSSRWVKTGLDKLTPFDTTVPTPLDPFGRDA